MSIGMTLAVLLLLPAALGVWFVSWRLRGYVLVPRHVAKHGWGNLDGDELEESW